MADQTMIERTVQDEHIEKLRSLMKGVNIAMLTTRHYDGVLHSRPMAMQQVEFNGDLWFFTYNGSEKVDDIRDNPQVNVSFSLPGSESYVSLAGHAMIMYDRAKIEELWTPFAAAWFPDGKDDPKLVLIKVAGETAEYWEGPGKVKSVLSILKAVITKQPADDMGKNESVTLMPPTPTYR